MEQSGEPSQRDGAVRGGSQSQELPKSGSGSGYAELGAFTAHQRVGEGNRSEIAASHNAKDRAHRGRPTLLFVASVSLTKLGSPTSSSEQCSSSRRACRGFHFRSISLLSTSRQLSLISPSSILARKRNDHP